MTRRRAAGERRRSAAQLELEWLAAWSPLVLLGVLATASGREVAASSPFWIAIVVLAPLVARHLARWLRPALVVAALAVATILVTEASIARTTWRAVPTQPATTNRTLAALGPQVLASGAAGGSAERVWRRRGEPGPVTVAFDLMRSAGPVGWSWYTYDAAFDVAPVPGAPGYARIVTPPNRGSYATRRIQTGAPLAGRTFRASLQLRTSEPLAYEDRACRGVLLREVGGSGAAACFAQVLSTEWSDHAFTWQVPEAATSETLRIELRIEAAWFEVGDVALEELTSGGWVALGPLEPAGVVVAAAVPGVPPVEWPTRVLAPGEDAWTTLTLEFIDRRWTSDDDLRVLVRLEPGTTVSLRNATATDDWGRTLPPAPLPARTQGWFGHPNLAGHGLAAIAVAAAAGAPTAVAAAAVAAASLVGIATTGSRTAFLVALLATAAVVGLRARRPNGAGARRWPWLLVGVAAAAFVFGALSDRGSFVPTNDGNVVPRADIWSFAWRVIIEHPVSGLGTTSFGEAWSARFAEAPSTPPAHAHNLWLELGAAHGVVGLGLALGWSLLLLRFARRNLQSLGLVVTGAVLLLQATDVTLSNTYVYISYVSWVSIAFADRRGSTR